MGLVLYALLIVVSVIAPKSKILSWFILIFMWITYAFNTYTPDGVIYKEIYTDFFVEDYVNHFEPAFSLLIFFCHWLGLSFQGFRIILASIYVVLIFFCVQKYSENTAYSLGLYLLFPFTFFVSVLRAGLSALIVLYSIHYLFTGKKIDLIKYIIGIVVASLFHYSSIIFIIFIGSNLSFSFFRMYLFMLGIAILVVVINFTDLAYLLVSRFTHNEKYLVWFQNNGIIVEGKPNYLGYVSSSLMLIGNAFITWLIKYQADRNNEFSKAFQKNKSIFAVTYKINVLMLLVIPLLIQNSVFNRLIYEMMGITIFSCAAYLSSNMNSIDQTNNSNKISVIAIFLVFWMLLIAFSCDYAFNRGTGYSAWDIFFDNHILYLSI